MSIHNVTLKFTALDAGMLARLREARKELQGLNKAAADVGRNASASLGNATKAASSFSSAASIASREITNSFNAAGRASQNFATISSRSAQSVIASNDRIANSVDGIGRKIQSMQRFAGWAAVLGVGAVSVGGIVDLIDGYTNLESKLRTVTDSEAQLSSVRERLFNISQNTRTQLESNVSLYARLTRATENQNLSDDARLRITETINKAFVISGATAQEAAASITQLSQGLAAGALRGEEFNSVAEQAPILLDMLAKSLGKTRGELRAMAFDGQLTSEVITGVLLKGSQEVDAQFSEMAVTIAGAGTQIANAFKVWIGDAQSGIGAANALASAMTLLAENMAPVANAVLLVAAAWTGKFIAGMIAAQLATTRQVAAAAALAVAQLNEARTAEVAAAAQLAHASAMAAAGLASGQLTAAQTALAAAQTRTAAAASAAAAAQAANVGMLARFGSGLTALVGGPVGVAIIALGALVFAFQAVAEAEAARRAEFQAGLDSIESQTDAVEELTAAFDALNSIPPPLADAYRESNEASKLLAEQQGKLAEAQERLNSLSDENLRMISRFGLESQAYAQAKAEVEALSEAVATLQASNSELTGDILSRLNPALESARAAIQRAIAAANVPDAFGILRDGIADFFASINAINGADVELNKILPQIQAQMKATEEAMKTAGKTAAEVAEETATLAREKAVLAGYSEDELAALDELLKGYVNNEKALIKAKNATRDAAKAIREKEKAERDAARAIKQQQREQQEALEAVEQHALAIDKVIDVYEKFKKSTTDLEQGYVNEIELLGRTNEEREVGAELLRYMEQNYEQLSNMTDEAAQSALEHAENVIRTGQAGVKAKQEINELIEQFGKLDNVGLDGLKKNLKTLQAELARVSVAGTKAFNKERALELQGTIENLNVTIGEDTQQALENNVALMQAGFRSLQTMTQEGSNAYKAMEVAMQAANVVAAIGAIVNQGMGDPYTAFARMAAMAAAVAGLVGSIGSFSGGPSSSGSAARQAAQGRGTVLGDAEAQSESIANGVEITAEACEELVGINRGMLNALQAMQRGIGSASGSLARTEFGNIDLAGGPFSGAMAAPGTTGFLLNRIFGGDQDLIDQGLLIRGGSFGNVSRDPRASSYQTIETDGGWFSGDDIDDELEALSESAITQIRLILTSLGDAVREGALALGLNADEINAAIEAFRIEEIRISTMDLTGEEAQAELEAAFSAIFDNLAGAVVPFIDQFQRVGEGLGETLVRVATSVQVTQEAITQLGLSIGELDPETMAQVSVALIDAAGGIDAFISGMRSFVQNFAPEAHLFALAQDELTRALAQVGLELPTTREGMWQLMQSLDATTESGRAQIATLLRLAGVADDYYSNLEDAAEAAADAAREAREAVQEELQRVAEMMAEAAGIMADARTQYAAPRNQRETRIDAINNSFDAWISQLRDLPGQLENITELEILRAEAIERASAAIDAEINKFLDGIEFDLNMAGLDEAELALAQINRRFDEYRARLIEQGATTEQLTRLEVARTFALNEATNAVRNQTISYVQLREQIEEFATSLNLAIEQFKDPGYKRWIEELTGFAPAIEEALVSRAATLETIGQSYAAKLVDLQLTQASLQQQLDAALGASGGLSNGYIRALQSQIALVAQAIGVVTGTLGDALEYANELFEQQINGVLADLRNEFGDTDPVAEVNARFDRLIERALAWGATEAQLAEIEHYRTIALQQAIQDGTDEFYQSQLDWLQRLRDLRDSLLLDENVTTLSAEERLAEARRQFDATAIAAEAGDEDARGAFEGIAREYANQLRAYFGSSQQYTDAFGQIIARINSLIASGALPPAAGGDPLAPVGTPGAGGSAAVTMTVSTPLVVEELTGLRADQERHTTRLALKLDALIARVDSMAVATRENTAAVKSAADKTKQRAY